MKFLRLDAALGMVRPSGENLRLQICLPNLSHQVTGMIPRSKPLGGRYTDPESASWSHNWCYVHPDFLQTSWLYSTENIRSETKAYQKIGNNWPANKTQYRNGPKMQERVTCTTYTTALLAHFAHDCFAHAKRTATYRVDMRMLNPRHSLKIEFMSRLFDYLRACLAVPLDCCPVLLSPWWQNGSLPGRPYNKRLSTHNTLYWTSQEARSLFLSKSLVRITFQGCTGLWNKHKMDPKANNNSSSSCCPEDMSFVLSDYLGSNTVSQPNYCCRTFQLRRIG